MIFLAVPCGWQSSWWKRPGLRRKETGHRFFKIKELFGSAFFINGTVFLTAKHVLEGALARSKETGLQYGLCQKYEEGKSPLNVICEVVAPRIRTTALRRSDWALGL